MDSHTISARFERLSVVDTGRRRRWTEDEKRRIVAESLRAPRLVSATAREHGISRSQLLTWRHALQAQRLDGGSAPGFVPAVIVPEPAPHGAPTGPRPGAARMEIVLARGRRIIVGADVDPAALALVLDVLEGR